MYQRTEKDNVRYSGVVEHPSFRLTKPPNSNPPQSTPYKNLIHLQKKTTHTYGRSYHVQHTHTVKSWVSNRFKKAKEKEHGKEENEEEEEEQSVCGYVSVCTRNS